MAADYSDAASISPPKHEHVECKELNLNIEFSGTRDKLECRLLWKLDLLMSMLVLIYILNFARVYLLSTLRHIIPQTSTRGKGVPHTQPSTRGKGIPLHSDAYLRQGRTPALKCLLEARAYPCTQMPTQGKGVPPHSNAYSRQGRTPALKCLLEARAYPCTQMPTRGKGVPPHSNAYLRQGRTYSLPCATSSLKLLLEARAYRCTQMPT
ncbi:hypothetical protein F4604DRAFT_1916216 [Suillus subluteus]|nr:hypothetical protein F4604DRAFT_1916216 [Suillus subluteus]